MGIWVIIKRIRVFLNEVPCHDSIALPEVADRGGDLPDMKAVNIPN
jgi:hypothetical protein